MVTSLDRFTRETAAGYDRDVINTCRIVVVGAGALGGVLMELLALVGFPFVDCVDMDSFEESNAPRAKFFRLNEAKSKAVATGAKQLCTAIVANRYRYAVARIQALGDALFLGPEKKIAFAAVDCPDARRWIAQRCRRLGVPMIEGGFYGGRWNASVIMNRADEEPCWACGQGPLSRSRVFSCDAYARKTAENGSIPASAPVAASLGAFMVGAMAGVLHGDEQLANSTITCDLRRGVQHLMRRQADSDCQVDHRLLHTQAVGLESGPKTRVCDLLAEVRKLAESPIISLPAAFIHTAPCKQCRKTVLVRRPEWAITEAPNCASCGGQFQHYDGPPEQFGFVSEDMVERLGDVCLSDVGLGPDLLLNVEGTDRQITVALAGDAESEMTAV